MRAPQALPFTARWPTELFPADLPSATARLRARLLARVGPDGAVREPCRSRILETALAAGLLERTRLWPDSQARAVGYLHAEQAAAGPLDRLLVAAALGDAARPASALVDEFTSAAPGFTDRRKRALIDAYFALFGVVPPQVDAAAFDTKGLHRWAAAQVTAVKVVLADTTGRPGLIRDEDVALLRSTQRQPWVWEGNVLIHLWALHALARLPGTSAVVAAGLRKALLLQRDDGGWPFVTDVDTWCTATAALALEAAGAPVSRLRPLAAHLLARQQPDGGWSYTDRARQTDADDTSVALEFLQRVDKRAYRAAIERGWRYLRTLRGPDGGFPTYVAGGPSEACMTAAAIDALTCDWPAHEPLIHAGLRYLADAQHANGGFDPDWSASRWHTVFRVVLACGRNPAGLPEQARRMRWRCLELVWGRQNSDGGWGQRDGGASDPVSTAYALIALCCQSDPDPAVRAASYLLDRQAPDGGVPSIPDSVGPRPLVFAIPVLADIFALLALGCLARRVRPAAGTFSHASSTRGGRVP